MYSTTGIDFKIVRSNQYQENRQLMILMDHIMLSYSMLLQEVYVVAVLLLAQMDSHKSWLRNFSDSCMGEV